METRDRTYRRGLFKGLTPNIIKLGLVSFFADVSTEMLYPVIPIFLLTLPGATPATVGLVEGVAEATASILKTVSGRLSDKSGRRRPYVLAGYVVSALAKPLIGLAAGWPLVMFARISDRLGKGLRDSPRDALIADSTSPEVRGKAFGWHRAMDTAGAVAGPLLALALLYVFHDRLRSIFLISLIPGLLGAATVLFVREHRRQARVVEQNVAFSALPSAFRSYILAWGAFALTNFSDAFLILRVKEFTDSLSSIILIYAFYNLVYAAASPGLGHLSDRLGRRKVLIGGLGVFSAVYIGFGLAGSLTHLWLLFAVYGLYTAATDGVGKAMAVDLVPPELRASAVGVLSTVAGIGALLAGGVGGLVWNAYGPLAAFSYGALGGIAGIVLLLRLRIHSGNSGGTIL